MKVKEQMHFILMLYFLMPKFEVFVTVAQYQPLTLKAPITTKADDNFDFFFFIFRRKHVLTFHVNRLPSR